MNKNIIPIVAAVMIGWILLTKMGKPPNFQMWATPGGSMLDTDGTMYTFKTGDYFDVQGKLVKA